MRLLSDPASVMFGALLIVSVCALAGIVTMAGLSHERSTVAIKSQDRMPVCMAVER